MLTHPTGGWSWRQHAGQSVDYGSAVPGIALRELLRSSARWQPFVMHDATSGRPSRQRGAQLRSLGRDARYRGESPLGRYFTAARQHWIVQCIQADTSNYDIMVSNSTMANARYNDQSGRHAASRLLPGSNVNYAPGFLANPHNYFIFAIQDHYEDNDADAMAALRWISSSISASDNWLDSLKFGVRHADPEAEGPLLQVQLVTGRRAVGVQRTGLQHRQHHGGAVSGELRRSATRISRLWSGHLGGDESRRLLQRQRVSERADGVYLNRATLADRDRHIAALSGATTNSPPPWTPPCERAENTEGCFIDPEILDVAEVTDAAYAMLRFGGDDTQLFGRFGVRGNIGVRYVRTR